MKKLLVTILAGVYSLLTFGFVLPTVGNGTAPGVWTSNITGVRAAAKQTGYPIFIAVINDSNSGEGCTHCKAFLERNAAGIERLAKSYKFYMVLLNYWSGAQGYSTLAPAYRVDFGTYPILPSICVRKPDCTVSAGWGYPLIERDITDRIQAEIEKYSVVKSTFSVAPASTSSAVMGTAWTGKITRSGNSKKTGTVALSVSGENAAQYTVTPSAFDWDAVDGAKSFTIQGPQAGTELRNDTLAVKITATGFSGSKIAYDAQQVDVTFKDPRVKQTLAEFKAANSWLTAASSTSTWYVPTSGNAELVCGQLAAGATGTLTLQVKKAGTLTLSGLVPNGGSLVVNGKALTDASAGFSVAANGEVKITASASSALIPGVIGLKSISYKVSNEKPVFPSGTLTAITAFTKVESDVQFTAESSTKVSYSADGLPDDMAIQKSTGKIVGAPKKAGTYNVTIKAKNEYGATEHEIKLVVGKLPATIKGNYSGILFDSTQSMVASATWKIAANGKCKVTIVRSGTKTVISSNISVDAEGNPKFSEAGLSLSRLDASGLWTGTWNGLKLFGKMDGKGDGAAHAGLWNVGLASEPAGYVTAKITTKGVVTVSGKISGKSKVAAKAHLIVLDDAVVAANLPDWYRGGSVAFAQGWKKSSGKAFDGGIALYGDGTIISEFTFAGVKYENVFGRKWNPSQSFRPLDGVTFVAGDLEKFRIFASSDKKIVVGPNDCKAKLSATQKSGIFKGSFKVGKLTCKFEGALFVQEGVLVGVGGSSMGSTPIAVGIGLEDD